MPMRPEEVPASAVAGFMAAAIAAGKPCDITMGTIRAALAAVIPTIQAEALERAAVVADKELADAQADMAMAGDSDPTGFQQSEGAAHASERIRTTIRAMKEPGA
jgi:hypothetical protein